MSDQQSRNNSPARGGGAVGNTTTTTSTTATTTTSANTDSNVATDGAETRAGGKVGSGLPPSEEYFCLDDGTGRNVYYISRVTGARSRNRPDGLAYELWDNGERRYYFRGSCLRCKKRAPNFAPSLLSRNQSSELFCLNICEECILATTPTITNGKIRGNGDKIWAQHTDTQKIMMIKLEPLVLDPNRGQALIQKAKDALHWLMVYQKRRRDLVRMNRCKAVARTYNVEEPDIIATTLNPALKCKYISFGFGEVFNEYYGCWNLENNLPHGKGLMLYSDGSIYVGEFQNGVCHTNGIGTLTQTNDLVYEGNWVLNQKHGKGKQRYPDGAVYTGEWAKGYEHGKGKLEYPDKSVFEGRFRFGKKDGPGQTTNKKGEVEKMNYKAKESHYNDKPPPMVYEQVGNPDVVDSSIFVEPEPLVDLCIKAVAAAMANISKRMFVPSGRIQNKLPNYLKPYISKLFLNIRYPKGTVKFIEDSSQFAFMPYDIMKISNTKLVVSDCEALLYFQNANQNLKTLELTSTRLDLASIDIICKQIGTKCWPNLQHVNFSFNKLEPSTVKLLLEGVSSMKYLESINLAACGINSSGAYVISQFLKQDRQIKILNLAFNKVQAQGADTIAEALMENNTLLELNLRSNDLGSVGGMAIAQAIRKNLVIRDICLTDNNVGSDVITVLAGRLRGSLADVMHAVRVNELDCPWTYSEVRFRQRRPPLKVKMDVEKEMSRSEQFGGVQPDWVCGECGNECQGFRTSCNQCGSNRPGFESDEGSNFDEDNNWEDE